MVIFAGSPIFLLVAAVYVAFLWVAYLTVPTLVKRYKKRLEAIPAYSRVAGFFAHTSNRGIIDIDRLAHQYKKLMLRILPSATARKKVILAIVIYSVFSFALLPLGFVSSEFFPKEDTNQFYIQVEYPSGTSLDSAKDQAIRLIPEIQKIPEFEFAVLETGKAYSESDNLSEQSNSALFSVRLTEPEDRRMTSIEIAEVLRKKFSTYTKGRIQVIELSGGPPAGADVQIALLGPDLTQLNRLADQVQAYMRKRSGLTNVDKSVKPGTSKIVFVPNQQKLAETGITQDAISQAMNLFTGGFTMDQISLAEGGDKKTDITLVVRKGYASVEELSQITVSGSSGRRYPIYELGSFESRVSPTAITREDGQRTISVQAATRPGTNATAENELLLNYVKTMDLPQGYTLKTGGVNEENAKSVQSILQAMLLSSVLILITMVVQFQSFRKAVIVLLVIPLAVSSVFLFFAVAGISLSFPALIGVLSLFGIVVTNSMFIVDKINLNLREGMQFTEAIADAGASRLEPIILTKLTAVFGLLPITLADALWRGLGGAIISGLLVASTIMLFFIPVVYYIWMRKD
jgi:HAE1 family hydrophobic/amphiphilic exporter-1